MKKKRKPFSEKLNGKTLNKIETKSILKNLKRKSKIMKIKNWEQYHGIIAKRVKDKEKIKEILIWDLKNIETILPPSMGGAPATDRSPQALL